jgi:hypothetical protein
MSATAHNVNVSSESKEEEEVEEEEEEEDRGDDERVLMPSSRFWARCLNRSRKGCPI